VAPVSAFVVLPLFALANAGITFHAGMLRPPGATAVFAGIAVARVVGKLAGITLACLVVVQSGLGRLPDGVRWGHVAGGPRWPVSASPFRCSSPNRPSPVMYRWCRPRSSAFWPGR
jgi:hypothetical protein